MKRLLLISIFFIVLTVPVSLMAATNPCWYGTISKSPDSVSGGDIVTFTARLWIKADVVTNLRVIGGVDGTIIYDNTFPSLETATRQDLSFTWTATAGTHTAFFQIDPDNIIPDIATDDLTSMSFSVEASIPDMAMNISFDHNSVVPDREFSGEESSINYTLRINITDPSTVPPFDIVVALIVNGRQISTNLHRVLTPGLSNVIVDSFAWHTECDATVEVVADPSNLIIETNEADNRWTHPVACVEPYRPNLIVPPSLVYWDPSSFTNGDAVTINYTINNIGEERSGVFKVGLKVGDRIVARSSHAEQPSGVTSTGRFIWTADCSEPLSIVADCDSEVIESNESDNTYQGARFACTSKNLKAISLSCSSGGSTVTADAPYQYTFRFDAEGTATYANVHVQIGIVGGELIYDYLYPVLGTTRSAQITSLLPAGSYSFYAVLDAENTITESNESDNRTELFIRSSGVADRRGLPDHGFRAGTNFKITIENKKALTKNIIHHSTDVLVTASLASNGSTSLTNVNIPVRLLEENLTEHTSRVIWEEAVSVAPNSTNKLKLRWNPNQAGKIRLTLSIAPAGGDSNIGDNSDTVTVKVD